MEITKKQVAIGLGAVAGVGLAAAGARFGLGIKTAVTQGGSPWGGTVNWWLARRGVIGFGVKETLVGNPLEIGKRWGRVNTIKQAEETVRAMENAVFYEGATQVGKKFHIGYDNGPDAFRHSGSSALITYRLMRDRAATADEAAGLLTKVGNAHERDSFLHLYDPLHARYSSEMDVFNNNVGSEIGRTLAAQHATMGVDEIARAADQSVAHLPAPFQDALRALDPGERVVLAKVLDGIEEGRSVTMTPIAGRTYRSPAHPTAPKGIHQEPHPSSFDDIFLRDADGNRQVRTMAPHAEGYPQPFRDGEYHADMERVRMDLRGLLRERPADVPQA